MGEKKRLPSLKAARFERSVRKRLGLGKHAPQTEVLAKVRSLVSDLRSAEIGSSILLWRPPGNVATRKGVSPCATARIAGALLAGEVAQPIELTDQMRALRSAQDDESEVAAP